MDKDQKDASLIVSKIFLGDNSAYKLMPSVFVDTYC